MNCRPGDLAIVVKAAFFPENIGKLVRVIGVGPLSEPGEWLVDPVSVVVVEVQHWGVDTGIIEMAGPGEPDIYFDDAELRPIRDNEGADETFLWAGLPHKQGEPA